MRMSTKPDHVSAQRTRSSLQQQIRVLLVEDNQSLVANVFAYLEPRHVLLDAARDGLSGLQLALEPGYNVVVLDWMLPRLDGLSVLARLRALGSEVPVLLLTARSELPDKLAGFRSGADDYLTKPFAISELEARIQALALRRRGHKQLLEVADLRYNVSTQEVSRAGVALHLHTGCKKLLELLMRESPGVVPKTRLEAALWGEDLPDRDMLRSHIYELRKRIDGSHPVKLLHTVARLGYRLALPDAST